MRHLWRRWRLGRLSVMDQILMVKEAILLPAPIFEYAKLSTSAGGISIRRIKCSHMQQ